MNEKPTLVPSPDDVPELKDLLDMLDNVKKRMVIEALCQSFGNITQACKASGVGRRTFAHWRQHDPIFAEIIKSEEFEEQKKDFAEHVLMQNIQNKKEISTIFFLKTKAKDRGYVEKVELQDGRMDPGKKPTWFPGEQEQLPDTSAFEYGFEEAEIVSETKNTDNAQG